MGMRRLVRRQRQSAKRRRAKGLHKVIGLVGLPRSGTTMLSSILSVHPRIEAVYEPWNRGDDESAEPDVEFNEFVAQFADASAETDILLVKETATHLTYLDYLRRLLHSAGPGVDVDLILLWRNPFHIFLSEIEARQKWWGEPDVAISAEEFDRWAEPRVGGLGRMIELGREFNALLVFYEALVSDNHRIVPALMEAVGLEFDPRQLQYEQHLDRARVRGDITVATDPAPISGISVRQREAQLPELHRKIEGADWYARVAGASRAVSAIEELGVVRFGDAALEVTLEQVMGLFWPPAISETPISTSCSDYR